MSKKIITVKCRKSLLRVNVNDFKCIHYLQTKKHPQIPKFETFGDK